MAICNNKKCSTGECEQWKDCAGYVPAVTNADRIRAMSDEELAKEFGHTSLCEYIQREYGSFCENRAVCTNCIVDWLKESSYV